MLAYILALLVGLGSFGLYMAAFFFPEVHRKNDFIWSGVGLFYALVLWVCAGRITGGVLLGQIAGVTLLGWLGWQTFLLRRQVAPVDQQTPLPTAADVKATFGNLSSPEGRSQLGQQASRALGQVKDGVQGAIAAAKQAQAAATPPDVYVPPNLEEFGTAGEEATARFAKVVIPEETAVKDLASEVQEAVKEVTADVTQRTIQVQDSVTTAAKPAASSVTPSRSSNASGLMNLPQKATNLIKVLAETVRSLVGSFQQQQASKPIYVRKEFRDQPSDAKPKITDATVISVIEDMGRTADGSLVAEATIEIESEDLAPDLLAAALADATAEDIVEELLEDISAQEQTPETVIDGTFMSSAETLEPVPPHPPSPDLVADAIADAEEKGLPYDPPEPEASHESA